MAATCPKGHGALFAERDGDLVCRTCGHRVVDGAAAQQAPNGATSADIFSKLVSQMRDVQGEIQRDLDGAEGRVAARRGQLKRIDKAVADAH